MKRAFIVLLLLLIVFNSIFIFFNEFFITDKICGDDFFFFYFVRVKAIDCTKETWFVCFSWLSGNYQVIFVVVAFNLQ